MLHDRVVELEKVVASLMRPRDPRLTMIGLNERGSGVYLRILSSEKLDARAWGLRLLARMAPDFEVGMRSCQHFAEKAKAHVTEVVLYRHSVGIMDAVEIGHASLDVLEDETTTVQACGVMAANYFVIAIEVVASGDEEAVGYTQLEWSPAGVRDSFGNVVESTPKGQIREYKLAPKDVYRSPTWSAASMSYGWLAAQVDNVAMWHPRAEAWVCARLLFSRFVKFLQYTDLKPW